MRSTCGLVISYRHSIDWRPTWRPIIHGIFCRTRAQIICSAPNELLYIYKSPSIHACQRSNQRPFRTTSQENAEKVFSVYIWQHKFIFGEKLIKSHGSFLKLYPEITSCFCLLCFAVVIFSHSVDFIDWLNTYKKYHSHLKGSHCSVIQHSS